MPRRAAICLLLLASVTPALAASSTPKGTPPGDADAALMAGMDRMNRAMQAAPMTGDADRDFVAMMLAHHAGAIDMAHQELAYGHDPAMRALAKAIVKAQTTEIAEMKAWQQRHASR